MSRFIICDICKKKDEDINNSSIHRAGNYLSYMNISVSEIKDVCPSCGKMLRKLEGEVWPRHQDAAIREILSRIELEKLKQ